MTSSQESKLDEILANFLRKHEAGEDVDPEYLIAAYPEYAEDIRDFFTDQKQFENMAGPLAEPDYSRRPVLGNIRYFGDFELIEEVARGGMGVVYKAIQTSLNRTVAIKVILSGKLASEADAKRFRLEAESAANLTHPNIVAVHEIGRHEGQDYFSMDFIDGKNLSQIVQGNPLPARQAAEYVRAIAEAVEYAHQQGTLHRDLKPSNVLIDAEGQVHVTDFGLAARVRDDSGLTRTGQILGTPSYMPPEQAQGNRELIGPASDVYSLGVILYELLTGRPPFKGESSVETLQQVVDREPLSPRALDASVPRDLETICLKCLRKEPGKRYPTAGSLAEDLSRWQDHKPILARPVGRLEKIWLWCRRLPAIASSMAAILLTACLVIGITVRERDRNLRKQVDAAVAALGTTSGPRVPAAIARLEEFPRELVVAELTAEFESADESQQLPLAYALANFGDARVDHLVSHAGTASPHEVDNLVAALNHSDSEGVRALTHAAHAVEDRKDWRLKARLAMLALRLDAPELAREMCQLRPDPVERTWFIEECATWHGDLSKLAELLSDSEDAPLRSAVALAAGSSHQANLTAEEKQAWEPILSTWFRNAADTLTHSAAGWTLRKWKLPLPEIPESAEPSKGRNWHINSSGMTMLRIPSGMLVRSDQQRSSNPGGCVMLRHSFLLADRETTRAQFQDFLDDPDCPAEEKPQDWYGADVAISPTEQHPVQNVSWNDAVMFCNWLSRRERRTPCYQRIGNGGKDDAWLLNSDADGYRLPTEAEWEYACRAGTATSFSHGEIVSLLDRYAVYDVARTEFPGSKLPNGWGLFDMCGNVWDWCHDRYGSYPGESLVFDPTGPDKGKTRVIRGGSIISERQNAKSGARTNVAAGSRYKSRGFRVMRRESAMPDGAEPFDRELVPRTLVTHLTATIDHHPRPWRLLWELAALKRFLGDEAGYRDTCREMYARFSTSENRRARHAMLLAFLSFPEGEVTSELLEITRKHAESRYTIHRRMLGLAYFRLQKYEEALPILKQLAAGSQAADSKIVSLLCLALAQLRLEQLDEARESIREARILQEGSHELNDTFNRQPWGVNPSLWREVEAAMEEKGLEEAIPDLPPKFGKNE